MEALPFLGNAIFLLYLLSYLLYLLSYLLYLLSYLLYLLSYFYLPQDEL